MVNRAGKALDFISFVSISLLSFERKIPDGGGNSIVIGSDMVRMLF